MRRGLPSDLARGNRPEARGRPLATRTPDLTAYFGLISSHLTNQLQAQERMVAALKRLDYENEASRREHGVACHAIQAELARAAKAMLALRTPPELAAAHAAHVRAVQQAGTAAGELGDALTGERPARVERISRALARAREAEISTRSSIESIGAALGAPETLAAHSVPVIGQIIAAILMAIAATIVLVATVLQKVKEDEAKEKDRP
jgi:hypothetical protein